MMHGGWMWNDGYGWGWGWGGWILMALVMIVFWALVITAIVLAVRYFAGGGTTHGRAGGGPTPTGGRAEDLLAERYARGEIDDDEYRRRLTLIREHR
jgi:putative membrane protein